MKFVYKPEGAEPREWDFNPARLMNPEVEVIERHTGMAYGEWMEAVSKGSMLALHGLLYVLLKRTTPTLRWTDVQFCLEDLGWELEHDEKVEMVANLQALADAGDLDREGHLQLEALRAEIEASDEVPVPLEA